jgi:hypothetical protein
MRGRELLSPSLLSLLKFYSMKQTEKRGGRPPQETTKTAKPTFKRVIPDTANMPRTYEVISGNDFILKIPSKNVRGFDPETKRVRALRYCPQENSPWVDEQTNLAQVGQVIFDRKFLTAYPNQPNLSAFLDNHPDNKANGGNLFQLLNKEETFEEDIEVEFKISDAISIIKSRPIDELLPVALALNINTNQRDLAIKHALIKYAKSNADNFLSTLDSPMVNARSVISQSIDFQLIEDRKGAVVWFDTGKMIISIPAGQNAIEVMTRFVMTDKGASVLSELERQLEALA